MAMIASYRAARLRERPALRDGLRQSLLGLRRAREERLIKQPPPAEPAGGKTTPHDGADVVAPDPAEAASIFAGLVSLAVAERGGEMAASPSLETPDTQPVVDPVAEAAMEARLDTPPDPPVAADPPLAEIGFGPGMLIRLSQLGLHTIGDLAQADASKLRAALGDISRLVDVETWINNARQNAARRP
jgi:hypothetical protein